MQMRNLNSNVKIQKLKAREADIENQIYILWTFAFVLITWKKCSKKFGNISNLKSGVPGNGLIVTFSFTGLELYFSNEPILKRYNAQDSISSSI